MLLMLANLLIITTQPNVFKQTLSILNYFSFFFLSNSNFVINLHPHFEMMAYGVTGNTSGFGPEESRFEP